MSSKMERLKIRAQEYRSEYRAEEVKKEIHKAEMQEILRQADWLLEQKFCFCDRWIWSRAVQFMKCLRLHGMLVPMEIRSGFICLIGRNI